MARFVGLTPCCRSGLGHAHPANLPGLLESVCDAPSQGLQRLEIEMAAMGQKLRSLHPREQEPVRKAVGHFDPGEDGAQLVVGDVADDGNMGIRRL
jgi:hypothetical protein